MIDIITKKRLCIFVIYDKEGIVDEYITFLLHSLKLYCESLIVVCNGSLQDNESVKLQCIADEIIFRENRGFDVTAWKFVLCKLIEEKSIDEYDEVILCNDSFYGPVYDWKEMFYAMDKETVDFWGITSHPKSYEVIRGHIPEHLQSFFIVIRRSMLISDDFYHYWKDIQLDGGSLLDAIEEHELRFTSYFEKRGYKWKAYVNTSELESSINEKLNYNTYYFSPLELVRDYRCPIIKKKALVDKNLYRVAGEEINLTLEYIEQKTSYDSSMIIENLVRIIPKEKLYIAFQLQYIAFDIEKRWKKQMTTKVCLLVLGKSVLNFESYQKKYFMDSVEVFQIKNREEMGRYSQNGNYGIIGFIDFSSIKSATRMENMRRSEDLIENMLGTYRTVSRLFNENKYLGIIYPNIYPARMEAAVDNFYQDSFWCRKEYFKEKGKFLYGTICTERYAKEQLSSFDYQFSSLCNIRGLPDIFNQNDIGESEELKKYLGTQQQFYIYGTGVYGRKINGILEEHNKTVLGFVVSDGQPTGKVCGKGVLTFSEFCAKRVKDSGVIVALSKKNQLEIKDTLKNSDITNVIYI